MTTKTNIEDVTFLIPVRIDSKIRLENLIMVVEFLFGHFKTHVHILEADAYNSHLLKPLLPEGVSVTFIEDHDPVFHRTRYINRMTKKCKTPYQAVWDTDVIVAPGQIIQSIQCLREKEAQFVYPYEDKFLEISEILRELYLKTRNLDLFLNNTGKMKELYLPNPVGGGFFADRQAYIASGLENETFYGWGREDGDRLNRWNVLGYSHKRIPGPMFHLTHDRGLNSRFHTDEQNSIKMSELHRIATLSKRELEEEVKSWQR